MKQTPTVFQRFARTTLASTLLTLSATAVIPPALADNSNVTQTQSYQIPAGPLAQSLQQFALKADVTLSYTPELVTSHQATALSGHFTTDEALAELLAGTGLKAIPSGEGYILKKAAVPASGTVSDDDIVLPHMNVLAAGLESGMGPVQGYIPTRSITAGKADIALLETPQSVSIVTADQIRMQNAESLQQALKYNSSISAMGTDSTTSDGMIIRGFNVTGASPMFLNGSKLARNTFSGVSEPYAMERIEILKGPASVLYGNAAPGGIINMVSKLPLTESQGELKIQGGSFDRRQVAGDITGSMTEDGRLSYRLTGLLRRSDTMTDYTPDDRDFLQGSIRWQPTDVTSLTLLANYQSNDTGYVYGLPAEGTVQDNINGQIDRDRFVGEPGFNQFEVSNHSLGYLFSHDFSDQVTFRQNLLLFDGETDSADIWIGSLGAGQRQISRGAYVRDDESASWSLDNQLEIKWELGASEHTSLVGVDYSEEVFERAQVNGTVAALDLYDPVYGSVVALASTPDRHWKEETKQLGIYAQEHIKFNDNWVVMLGGRYDKVKVYDDDKLTGTSETTYDDDALTGRAGLVYLFDNGFAPYVSYAESFQPTTGQGVNGNAFDPTEGEQYELGLRYQPEGQDVMISASVYKLTQTNVTTADLDNPGFSVQEGEVESKGFELEAKAGLTKNLNLIASYSYIDNAVTKSNSGTEGNRYGNVPRHAASLWADYKLTEGALNGLGLGAGVRYAGTSTNLANSYDVPAYTVVDAVVNYQLSPKWDLALNISNLFDEEYATCSYACFYGVRRSAYLTATYGW